MGTHRSIRAGSLLGRLRSILWRARANLVDKPLNAQETHWDPEDRLEQPIADLPVADPWDSDLVVTGPAEPQGSLNSQSAQQNSPSRRNNEVADKVNPEHLVPVMGCWVQRHKEQLLGEVRDHRDGTRGAEIKVRWGAGTEEWVPLEDLQSGLQIGWAVQDIPWSTTRRPLGVGQVVARRKLGGREQILVQLEEDGRSIWLPYENLRRLMDVRMRFERIAPRVTDHGERFRLRILAHALENWNHLTGSLDRLDVDPLPHQIQLVHRILSSGNYNWLVADDVGLGKTIEVGLLIAALKRKGQARRVLVIAPSGLTRQWQDELQYKFGEIYEIYGRDFIPTKPEQWKIHDHVIVSVDLAKREDHLSKFQQAGGWDLVVFDESHKLTRYSSGERAQRYRLAEAIRQETDGLLLLSGTPHQGYADRFRALLELVRPDLKPQIHALEVNPEIASEMVLRNRKSEVTDADGNFIFKGTQIHRVPVEPSAETLKFQQFLNDYLRRGYKVGERGGVARAVGFVMTTYRKLASSSVAAIEKALQLRLRRLSGDTSELTEEPTEDISLEDLSQGGDDQDNLTIADLATRAREFFAFERDLIEALLTQAAVIRRNDEKLIMLLVDVIEPLIAQNKKLLIFTEYRATQVYIQEALAEHFPEAGEIALINGSMSLDEKLAAINTFNNRSQFLISTEAGGEGINLHHSCHVMVNYDLPWNPARLVQRIGRLYRYGQQETVIVFNLHARDSFDNYAIDLMMERVMRIVRDLAPMGSEFNERLYAEILGEVLDNVDLASILQSATAMEIGRTREQIEEAIARAELARKLEQDIFAHAASFEPDALRGTLGFTMQHVDLFIRSMLPLIGVSPGATRHNGNVLEIRLPEQLRGKFPEFAQRAVISITTDRRLAQRFKDIVLLDFETDFFRYLIVNAKSHEFDGYYAAAQSPPGIAGALGAFILRWQNDQGTVLTEEFFPAFTALDGSVEGNPSFLARWLVSPLSSFDPPRTDRDTRKRTFDKLVDSANRRLATESTKFKHPNRLVYLAAADCICPEPMPGG
jgi:superfamily II DNA or RNA helicase